MIPIDLAGKTCLITGGTRGIGAAVSLALARAGASTAAVYRADEAAARRSLDDRQSAGGVHRNYRADIADMESVDALARVAADDFSGGLHGLVLNAGIGLHRPAHETTDEEWRRVLDTNLTSALRLVRAFRPMLSTGSSIVAIASGAGHEGLPGFGAYGASKAGLILFTQSLAQDLGPSGIRANVVSPGFTDTEFSGQRASEERRQRAASSNALRRVGTPDDVAGAVLFFLSDLSAFVTGQALRVNGGAL
ncbi:MAG: SDR family NAD(P)-dependent oxidoreductase [Capsulimonadaceae bacterium]